MRHLTQWLQTNPIAVLAMFIVSFASGIAGLVLGWKQLYADYLSKTVEVPMWLVLLGIATLPAILALARTQERKAEAKELDCFEGRQFGVQRIVADGKSFERCEFHGTEIVIEGNRGFTFNRCSFSGQRFVFDGPAGMTLKLLSAWYREDSGFRPFAEQIFEDIKRGGLPGAVPPAKL